MTTTKEDLRKFREQIDKIDSKIVDLLKERHHIVEEVGRYKAQHSNSKSFIRSGREASMLRSLTKKLDGTFPPEAIATIWRMIISASLVKEQGLTIAAYVSETNPSCYWLAREYYGSFIPIRRSNDAEEIIKAVADNEISVGILPCSSATETPWWARPSEEKNDIYVFARIPFVDHGTDFDTPAIAIANVMPEPTEEDASLLAITTTLDNNELMNVFEKHNVTARLLSRFESHCSIELHQFVLPTSEIVGRIRNSLPSDSIVRLLGSYATPITISR